MAAALRRAGLEPPLLDDRIREFRVTVSNHGLLDDEALAWLATLQTGRLNDHQRLALAFLRRSGSISNMQYRALTGRDAATATRELAGMSAAGLVEKHGEGRWTVWRLAAQQRIERQPELSLVPPDPVHPMAARVLELLQPGPLRSSEIAAALGVTKSGALKHLRDLEAAGRVDRTEGRTSSPTNRWLLRPH
jgi:ATP-dependent DNA helicase RecG